MLGEQLSQVLITERGAVGDRAFAVRDLETSRIASAKKFLRLFDFRATFDSEPTEESLTPITIRLPDGNTIHADDQNASEAIGAALGRKVRLERSSSVSRELAGIDPKTIFLDVPVEKAVPGFTAETLPDVYPLRAGTFFDSAPMHLIASGTLRHMAKLTEFKSIFEPRRFRPTIFVDTGALEDHFIEDDWLGGTIVIGKSARIDQLKPALRCVMTTHPQNDIPRDPQILRTAAQHHQVNVGVFAAVAAPGLVRLGDPVYLES